MTKKDFIVFFFVHVIPAFVVGFLLIDFICFIAWHAANQVPGDSFYLGAITNKIITIISH